MTQDEFLIIASQNPTQVNIWYTDTAPYVILGLTVPTITNTQQDMTAYLEQVDTLTVQVNDQGDFSTVEILTRSQLGQVGAQYYYFTVRYSTIQTLGDQQVTSGEVIFSPGIVGPIFTNSGYDAVGLLLFDRQSTYIQQADRLNYGSTGGGLPTNVQQLGNYSAILASIQDSYYSDSGWISGRYEGSKTSENNYGNITPAIQGTSFQGSYFSNSVENATIFAKSDGEIVYSDYLFTGLAEVPTYAISYMKRYLYTGINTTTTVLQLGSTAFQPKPDLKVGDLLQISDNYDNPYAEILQIARIDTIGTGLDTITVVRGWNDTPKLSYNNTNKYIYRIDPVKVYTIAKNKIQAQSKGKIKVRDTSAIINIDKNGYITSSSLS